MLDDLVNGMQVLAPYFKADGQIAHHAATVCSKSLGSGKLSATEGDGTNNQVLCLCVCICVCVSMCVGGCMCCTMNDTEFECVHGFVFH